VNNAGIENPLDSSMPEREMGEVTRRPESLGANRLLWVDGLTEADQVLWHDTDDAVAWAVDFRDEHEGDGGDERQNHQQSFSPLRLWKPQPTIKLQ
jgi:hypothetical protein